MRKLILFILFFGVLEINAQTKEESLEKIQKLSQNQMIQRAFSTNSLKEIFKLQLNEVNSMLISLLNLEDQMQEHEALYSKDKSFDELYTKILVAKRVLTLKKNEIIIGHIIDWERTSEWINNERRRIVTGGKIARAKKWSVAVNDPHNIFKNRDYKTNFYNLSRKGSLDKIPYSDDYWPTYRGGISYRWYETKQDDVKNYGYELHTAAEIEKMSLEELKKLSPSEKYDIYTGSYKAKKNPWALTRSERKRTSILKTVQGNPSYDPNFKIQKWMGLCHAWAPSTLMYEVPKAITLKGKTGIKIPFGSSDIKALLTLNVHYNIVPYLPPMVGNACKEDFRKSNRETIRMLNPGISNIELEKKVEQLYNEVCGAVDPGAFHIVLANKLSGPNKEGIIIDIDPGEQVWNQPVISFDAQVISSKPLESNNAKNKLLGVSKAVVIKNTISYIKELSPRWEGSYSFNSEGKNRAVKPVELVYELYLDGNNKITGGKWLSKERIDYVSTKYDELFTNRSVRKVTGLKYLQEIYNKSIRP